MEASIRALRGAFSGEHAGRVFAKASIRIHAARVRIVAGQIFHHQEFEQLSPVVEGRRRYLGYFLARQAQTVVLARHLLTAHRIAVVLGAEPRFPFRPALQQLDRLPQQLVETLLILLPQAPETLVFVV